MNRLLIIICIAMIALSACSSSPQAQGTLSNTSPESPATPDNPGAVALPLLPSVAVKDFVADAEPYDIGVIALSTTNALGIGISPSTGTVQFAPRTNTLIVNLNQSGNKMEFYFDAKDRMLLSAAIRQYIDEFVERKLNRDKDMDSVYSSFITHIEWGMFTKNAIAEPKSRLGYIFIQGSPYFSITYPEAENLIYRKELGSHVQRSAFMRWYFTRTQAQAFGDFMDQAYLESTVEGKAVPKADRSPDEY